MHQCTSCLFGPASQTPGHGVPRWQGVLPQQEKAPAEKLAQEYARAAHLLAALAPGPHSGGGPGGKAAAAGPPPKALFLRAYSLYLAGEQRREWVGLGLANGLKPGPPNRIVSTSAGATDKIQ